jgi:hypothetical protein
MLNGILAGAAGKMHVDRKPCQNVPERLKRDDTGVEEPTV